MAQFDQVTNQMKNVSFDDGDQMVSLIQRKKDDSAIEAFSEVGNLVGKLTNVRQQGVIPSGHGVMTVGGSVGSIPSGPVPSPSQSSHPYPQIRHVSMEGAGKDGAPFVPEVVAKTSGDKGASHPASEGIQNTSPTSSVPGQPVGVHPQSALPGLDQGASQSGAVFNNYVGQPQATPSSDQTSPGVRVNKQTLRDSLGPGTNLHDNSLLEYFIDEQGYLVDASGNPLLDEAGQPVLLTEENIKYLRNQNMLDE